MDEETKQTKELIEKRKEKIFNLLKDKKTWLIYLVLVFLAWFSYYIRTRNLWLLNGQLADPDAHLFYRYALYILEHGKLFVNDTLRYYPLGYNTGGENIFVSYFVVYLYKFLHLFNSILTLKQVDILYPAIMFIPSVIIFYFLVKKLFDYKVALLSSAFLVIIPAFLFRTMSGVSDKEGLAIPFMFAALYFYVCAWQSKKLKISLIFGLLAGFFTAITGMAWGGVQFLFLIIAMFTLIEILLNKFTKKDFVMFISWFLSMFILLITIVPGRFQLESFVGSPLLVFLTFVCLLSIVDFLLIKKRLFKIKEKFSSKIPDGFISLFSSLIIGLIITIIIYGPSFLFDILKDTIVDFTAPFGKTRWQLTVAESHQPYLLDLVSNFTWVYFLIFIVSSIILFYECFKIIKNKKIRLILTSVFAIFIFLFIFSRYSPSSILNGDSGFAKVIYLGSFLMFILIFLNFYFKSFYKDKSFIEEIKNINKDHLFVLVWFFVMIVAARSALRLIFVLAPITVILVSYFFFRIAEYFKNFKSNSYKILGYIIIIVVIIFLFNGFTKTSLAQSKYIGPIFDNQWQSASQWALANTKEDSVFAHWWDYGYLVQTGFNRTTITDGGNAVGAWNYFVGRHVLTAQNETEALEFLKTHEVGYLLIVSDEIGKYPAYSAIGSDKDYDRYSWINTFSLDLSQTQETRNQTIYLYRGGTILDEDLIYEGKLLPRKLTGIAGFFIPFQTINNQTIMEQPTAILFYNNQRIDMPLECIFFNDREITFNKKGISGCLRIIPVIDENNQVNQIGAALYLSPKVRRTLFTKLYIYGQETENFKLAYSDEDKGVPLAIYRGRLIGPLRIWEINYPKDIKINPTYLMTVVPDTAVEKVNPDY